MRAFALKLFDYSELLWPLRHMYDAFFQEFMTYKGQIPTYGCIMLNASLDKMVLVCNWKGSSWGFPKGKLNEGEDGAACAARETEEETGFRCPAPLSEDDCLPDFNGGQRCNMYVVPGVPEDYPFQPLVRKEISKINFYPFDAPPKSAWNVSQFIPKLKRWVKEYRKKQRGQRTAASREASVEVAGAMATGVPTGVAISVNSLFGSDASATDGLAASVASFFGVSSAKPAEVSPKSVLLRPPGLPVEASVDGHHARPPTGRPPRHPQLQPAQAQPAPAASHRRPFVFDLDDILAAIPVLPAAGSAASPATAPAVNPRRLATKKKAAKNRQQGQAKAAP